MIDQFNMKLNGIYRHVPRNKIANINKENEPKPLIIGAYHIALFPGWQTIVDEQIIRLTRSGLLDITDHILVGIVGVNNVHYKSSHPLHYQCCQESFNTFMLNSRLANKAILIRDRNIRRYEFITLEALQNSALSETSSFLAWYIHTKGVSNCSEGARRHRYQMEEIVIDRYRECIEMLESHDVCARSWSVNGFGAYRPHSPGNFWWARSSYLCRLPRVYTLNHGNRYEAEFWIGKSEPVVGVIR